MLKRGMLCVIEPPTAELWSDFAGRQLAGLFVVTQEQSPYPLCWYVQPPAMIDAGDGATDREGYCARGLQEIAVHESWLRPIRGDREPETESVADVIELARTKPAAV